MNRSPTSALQRASPSQDCERKNHQRPERMAAVPPGGLAGHPDVGYGSEHSPWQILDERARIILEASHDTADTDGITHLGFLQSERAHLAYSHWNRLLRGPDNRRARCKHEQSEQASPPEGGRVNQPDFDLVAAHGLWPS